MKYLDNFHFRYLKRCGFFSDNTTMYEIDHCVIWELLQFLLIFQMAYKRPCFLQCKEVRFLKQGKFKRGQGVT